jgi:hypothetical protein
MFMSVSRLGCFFALLTVTGAAFAQQTTPPQPGDERAAWLKTCLNDWDTSSHMSKREWRATCERVSSERAKYLPQKPDTGLTSPHDRSGRPKR